VFYRVSGAFLLISVCQQGLKNRHFGKGYDTGKSLSNAADFRT
jgi:hypothetical protein